MDKALMTFDECERLFPGFHRALKDDPARFLRETVWPQGGSRVQEAYNHPEVPSGILGNCPNCQTTLFLNFFRAEVVEIREAA